MSIDQEMEVDNNRIFFITATSNFYNGNRNKTTYNIIFTANRNNIKKVTTAGLTVTDEQEHEHSISCRFPHLKI